MIVNPVTIRLGRGSVELALETLRARYERKGKRNPTSAALLSMELAIEDIERALRVAGEESARV